MLTIRFKGKRSRNNTEFVKLYLIIHLTDCERNGRLLYISGFYKDWDSKAQRFKEINTDNKTKNHLLEKIKLKYLKIAERLERDGKRLAYKQLSHYYNKDRKKNNRLASVSAILDSIMDCLTTQITTSNKSWKKVKRNIRVSKGKRGNYNNIIFR